MLFFKILFILKFLFLILCGFAFCISIYYAHRKINNMKRCGLYFMVSLLCLFLSFYLGSKAIEKFVIYDGKYYSCGIFNGATKGHHRTSVSFILDNGLNIRATNSVVDKMITYDDELNKAIKKNDRVCLIYIRKPLNMNATEFLGVAIAIQKEK